MKNNSPASTMLSSLLVSLLLLADCSFADSDKSRRSVGTTVGAVYCTLSATVYCICGY